MRVEARDRMKMKAATPTSMDKQSINNPQQSDNEPWDPLSL